MLTKAGFPEVQFELRRSGRSGFEMIENGRVVGLFTGTRVFFRTVELREAWEACIAKRYPGYQVSNMEEWVPE